MRTSACRSVRALAAIGVVALVVVVAPAAAIAAPGELDGAYATGGVFTGGFQTEVASVREQFAVVDSQRRTVIAATHVDAQNQSHLDVMRLTAQGALDTTFNPGGATPGVVEVDFSATVGTADVLARGVAVTSGDKVVALGEVNGNGGQFTALVRLGSDGSYDPTFGPGDDGRMVDVRNPNWTSLPDSLAVDSSGRILVGGSCGTGCGGFIARYLATGAPDTAGFDASSSHQGVLVIAAASDVPSLAALSDGSVLVAGGQTPSEDALIARVGPDGNLDATFNSGGATPGIVESGMGHQAGGQAIAYGVAPGPGASVYVTGQVVDNGSSMRLLRLTSTGAPDTAFGTGSPATGVVSVPATNARGLAITVDGSSCPVAVGWAAGTTGNQILAARLTPSGQLDTAFNPTGPTPGTALFAVGQSANGETVALQDDGNIVIGGYRQQGTAPVDRKAVALRLQGGGCGGGGGPAAPTVVTGQATNVSSNAATLNGTVNPNGAQLSDCHFDYGTSTNYGSSVACSQLPASGNSPVTVSAPVSGLASGTTYDYRLVAGSPGGTTNGTNLTLTTTSPTTITTSQTAGAAQGASITVPAGTTGESDVATITGASAATATGTVTFALYSSPQCTLASQIFTSTNFVDTFNGPATALGDPVTQQLGPGTYYWTAAYSGDGRNLPSSTRCGDETLTVAVLPPTSTSINTLITSDTGIVLKSAASIDVLPGAADVQDHATISGAHVTVASGAVIFTLYSDRNCASGSAVFFSTVPVHYDRAQNAAVATSDSVPRSALPANGLLRWTAYYTGDSQNLPAFSGCGDETVLVAQRVPTSLFTSQQAGTSYGSQSMTIPWWTTGETDTVSVNPTVTAVGTPSGPVTLLLYSGACLGTAGPRTLVLHTDVNLDQYDHASSGPVTQTLAPGTYHWTAMYGGDLSYAPSTSACDDLIVTAPVAGLASTTSSVLSLPLNCPVALCRLHVTVTAPVPQLATDARTPHKRSRLTITLARGTVTIRKHGTQTVALRLTSTGRRFVASHHGRVTATATIATTIGGHTRTVKSRLTLRLATPGNRQQHRRP